MKLDKDKICVKELANALQVSTRFVYEMRRCGFKMSGIFRHNQTATVVEAVEWIKQNDFRIVNGVGVIDKLSPV